MKQSTRRRIRGAAALAAVLPILAACSNAGTTTDDATSPMDDERPTVMIQAPTLDNSYWADLIAGAEAAAEALDLNFDLQVYGDSTDTQLSQVQQAGSKGVDMAMLFAQDQAASPTLIKAATDQDIFTTNIFSNAAWSTPLDAEFNDKYVGYFVPDNVKNSYNMAKSVFEQIGAKGKVIEVTGIPGNTTAEERILGVSMALDEYPDIELVGSESGGENRVATQPIIEDLLTAHPDVDAVVAHNDDSAMAVVNALRDRGMSDVKVGGIDAIDEFLTDMESGGNAAATVAIHGYWFGGYQVVRLYDAYMGAEYSPAERMMFQDSLTIDTADAAAAYKANIYDADPQPWDWKAMSRAENPETWDTQVAWIPIDPNEYWGRIDQPKPADYELPDALVTDLDNADQVASTFLEHSKLNPLLPVIELTRAGETSYGQK